MFPDLKLDLQVLQHTTVRSGTYKHFDASEYPSYPGKEHYKLLSFLAQKYQGKTIIDVGTHRGASALALSSNSANHVQSFDIVDQVDPELKKIKNITFNLDNLWDLKIREKWKETLLSSPLIFLDVDPHNGKMELEFYEFLKQHDYQGILICDDIWYFKEMRDHFWYHVPTDHKCDVTKFGHWSGTGLISFNKHLIGHFRHLTLPNLEKERIKSARAWTFVTAYFDLTKCSDASQAINDRPNTFYLNAANTTMSLDANLVVFTEPRYVATLEALRPAHLKHKTKYITMEFDDFPLNKYRQRILDNRKKVPSADPRNTPSYYLFCMARYEMLKNIIAENPFKSTHFGWINVCIERYGYRDAMALEGVMNEFRDKFSTCYIDYIPPSMLNNPTEFWQFGRCSLCSGFFTGNGEYMTKFCQFIEQEFMTQMEAGYGHADEQLYSFIYFAHPEIFEIYFADYLSMVTNYVKVVEDVGTIIGCLIKNAFSHGNYQLANAACKAVWKYCHTQQPGKERPYMDVLSTSILGPLRQFYLRTALIVARNVGDYDFASKVLVEIKCLELGQ